MAAVTGIFARDSAINDLEEKGFTVVPNVISVEECDDHIASYRRWVSQFGPEWPFQRHSIVQGYAIGHFECTWKARLSTKPVFASLWETEKLLTSIDGVAMSPPPEGDKDGAFNTGEDWLHFDQSANRIGLHHYQGALYLEESSDTDYCFRVLEGSHKYFAEFYEEFEIAGAKSVRNHSYRLLEAEKEWLKEKGLVVQKVPVPKGGMVVWDSRLVHDNCKPEKGRPHPDRWRHVVFVCMSPARWARPEDIAVKQRIYKDMLMSGHSAAQGIRIFEGLTRPHGNKVRIPTKHTKIAQTKEVQMLAGNLPYNFDDGKPNGPNWQPIWAD